MLSPGVEVREIDLSIRVPEVSKAIACFAGVFTKGPIDEKVLVTSVDDLIYFFGKPTKQNYNDWFQVYNFLQYANKIYVARAGALENGTLKVGNAFGYATVKSEPNRIVLGSTESVIIKNPSDFEQMMLGTTDPDVLARTPRMKDKAKFMFAAQTYGEWGEHIEIGIATKDDFVMGAKVAGYTFSSLFEYHPGTDVKYCTIGTSATVAELDVIFKGKISEVEGDSIDMKIVTDGVTKLISGEIISKEEGALETQLLIDVTSSNLDAVPDTITLIPQSNEIGVVICENGNIVEKYIVSTDEYAKDYQGKSTYIENVINKSSQYVYVMDHKVEDGGEVLPGSYTDSKGLLKLTNSVEEQSNYDIATPYATAADNGLFSNKEEFDVDLVIANEADPIAAINLAKDRADCIAFVGARQVDCVCAKSSIAVTKLVDYVTSGELNVESSFAAFFGNYKYQYDKWNDTYRWVNVAGDVAGLRADTNTRRDVWWASAGIDRGQVKNAIKLAFNPNNGERDILYKSKVNPIVGFPGQGNAIVWGQKTLQSKPSAFDRINVRGLFNTLERAISRMAKYYLFEINDEFTRNRFVSTVEPFLREVKANRGVYDYYVRCDEKNNTPYVIDNNQFIADIAIKPARTAEFMTLNFIAVGTGVDFNEIFA